MAAALGKWECISQTLAFHSMHYIKYYIYPTYVYRVRVCEYLRRYNIHY